MKYDIQAILQFLKWLYPQGPWALTLIHEDRKQPTRTRTFYPRDESNLNAWIEEHNHKEHWNVYYHVNKPTHDVSKKAEREEIAEMRFLHVDVDPRVGEKLEEEHERILKLFKSGEKLPPGLPEPSGLVFSGGGYNGLWRLQDSVRIAQDGLSKEEIIAAAEDAKRWNLQLEILFGGDNCHNVDRILRVPGTVNWPDAKKRAKGRQPTLAKLVWTNDGTYPISRFVPAQQVQRGGAGIAAGGGVKVNVSGNVRRLGSIDELGEAVPDRLKMIIVQGHDPDEPNKFGTSRSEWLFHVCCGLVRSGCSDETIYSVITDPGFLISTSVLDKGSMVERYALRQIQRAREDAIDPNLRRLNEKHAVIGNTGGRCRIIEEVMDYALERPRLTHQSFEDFKNRYMAERVEAGKHPKTGEPQYQPLGAWWLNNSHRRQFESIVFAPGREIPNCYNLWRGFSVEAKPGNKHETFLNLIKTVHCGGVERYYDYLIKWMARAVQHPDTQGETCVVFRGEPGTGKGTVATEFGNLWGRHFLQISDPKHLVGSFNAHLRDAVVVFADEAFYAGDKKHESILKTLVTEDLLAIEGKGRDMETSRNYVHLMMASNQAWVVPVDAHDRRYFVLDVLDTMRGNRSFWNQLHKEMNEGGRENLLHYLLTLDISDYDVRDIPQTEGLRKQKELSFSPDEEWWYSKLQSGILLRGHGPWTDFVYADFLIDDYLEYTKNVGVSRRSNQTALGRFLQNIAPAPWPRKRQKDREVVDESGRPKKIRSYAYQFPPLDECRKWWDEKFGGPYVWDPIEVITEQHPNAPKQESAF